MIKWFLDFKEGFRNGCANLYVAGYVALIELEHQFKQEVLKARGRFINE